MRYEKTIIIDDRIAGRIRTYTDVEPSNRDECLSEDATITYTARFDNGYQMDIKCCGVQYHEGETNTAWTEAVLFDANGCEICFSEPSDEYFGMWELEADGDTYIVYVKSVKEKRREAFEKNCYQAYQLDWMISHGWSLADLADIITGLAMEAVSDPMNIPTNEQEMEEFAEEIKDRFLDTGFGSGSLFCCMDEFLGAEFRDRAYMEHLLSCMPGDWKMKFWKTHYTN